MSSETISPVEVMQRYRTIAVVGASKSPEKEAHIVPKYLKENGYRIIPINPTAKEVFEEKAYPSLLDLPREIAMEVDVVEVFRPSEELPQIATRVVEMKKRFGRPFVFWAQAELENDQAKGILTQNGIPYVMNKCMRVVHSVHIRAKVS